MKTDALFYELFQTAPQTFFELLQITPLCLYRFESLTLKTSEKRIDGVLEPEEENRTIYFLEVQASPDETIYWRTMREVSTYFEQRPKLKDNDWQAIILWLNITDDPGFSTLSLLAQPPSPRLIAADLLQLLRQLNETALALNVLGPLVVETEIEVRQNVLTWVENIQQTPGLDKDTGQRLITVLSQFIEQRFRTLTYKELSHMLRLTPLEETASGQELLKNERVETLTELIQLKFVLSPGMKEAITVDLQKLDLESLKALLRQILKIETIEQLESWIKDHLPENET